MAAGIGDETATESCEAEEVGERIEAVKIVVGWGVGIVGRMRKGWRDKKGYKERATGEEWGGGKDSGERRVNAVRAGLRRGRDERWDRRVKESWSARHWCRAM